MRVPRAECIIPLTIDGLPVDELVLRDTQAIDWNADRKHASTRLSQHW